MEITLVRHTSVGVPKGTCYGWSDVPVADTFEAEASETHRQLEMIVKENGPFDAVYSSPLTRARLLAEFCGFPQPIVDERLKEMFMGDWEMRRYEDIEREDPHIHQWYNDYLRETTTGGESFPLFYQRVASFFNELATKPSRRVLIFAHGGVLACAAIFAGLYKPVTKEYGFFQEAVLEYLKSNEKYSHVNSLFLSQDGKHGIYGGELDNGVEPSMFSSKEKFLKKFEEVMDDENSIITMDVPYHMYGSPNLKIYC